MTFVVCGFVTILQSALLLRLPIIQGRMRKFATLLAAGHIREVWAERTARFSSRR